jgi:hypothetical protein
MTNEYISVILPEVSDNSKLPRFCSSLFGQNVNVELIICGPVDTQMLSGVSEDEASKIKIFPHSENKHSFFNALKASTGALIMISDVDVTFANGALEKMAEEADECGCACNVALVSDEGAKRLLMNDYSFDELSSYQIYFNHLIRKSVIDEYNLSPVDPCPFSFMNFFADYYRYDGCKTINEVLIYTDSLPDYNVSSEEWDCVPEYASVFSETHNDRVSAYFLRNIVNAYISEINKEKYFSQFKAAVAVYYVNYGISAWLKATFGFDVSMLADENSNYSDFKTDGMNVWYKEINMPILADNVIMDFYSGKLSYETLKKCIGAWLYYKLYRRKNDVVKKIGCRICKRLLGGDFNV